MHKHLHHRRPSLLTLLLTQLLDGFGARFHSVLLALYMLRVSGMGGLAGFTALGLVGVVLSTIAAGWLTNQLGGRRTMRVAGIALAATRVATYALVGLEADISALLVLRLVGSTAGALLMNTAKAQVDGGSGAASSLAWMSVANALGQTIATVCAAGAAQLPSWLIAVLGAPTAILSTLPMLGLARFAITSPVSLRAQLGACKSVAPAALLAASVQLFISGLASLKDGLTIGLYSSHWLGAVAATSLAGSFVAAAVLPRLARYNAHPRTDVFVWPLLGACALVGWAFADAGVAWLLASQFVGGIAGQTLAAFTEARILAGAGRENAVPALTISGGASAFASAVSAVAMPPLLAHLGYAAGVVVITAPLLVLSTYGAARLFSRFRRIAAAK